MQKLLLVDDDLTMGPLLRATLKNFEVTFETSGVNALAVAANENPKIILLDLHMPNVDGFEVLRKLKTHPLISAIPVFCLSGASDQESRDRAVSLGAAGYFVKPISLKTFQYDLETSLNSMNSTVSSENGRRHFTIAFNDSEKRRLMKDRLNSALQENETPLVLSLMSGEDFIDSTLESDLIAGKWHYLQITPATLAKLPYLQDLTPLAQDIQNLTLKEPKNLHLILDDPNSLIGGELMTANARFHSLKNFLSEHFYSTSIYADLEGSQSRSQLLKEMAHYFCAGGGTLRSVG